jgi:hypothetical protein
MERRTQQEGFFKSMVKLCIALAPHPETRMKPREQILTFAAANATELICLCNQLHAFFNLVAKM